MIYYNGDYMVLLIIDDISEREKQKKMLQEKNEQLFSSIRYAERIQKALLPESSELAGYFKDYFLFYEPKEIIGGDFYWGACVGDKSVAVVSDCTGHGIPGALITMLGISGLNDIVKAQKETRPDVILNKLRNQIIDQLTNSASPDSVEGMEISICTIDHHSKEVWFAGANQKIIHASNGDISEINGDTIPIGSFKREYKYTLKKFTYRKNDMLYLYSDGYKDQFGEAVDKKFGKRRFHQLINDINNTNLLYQKKAVINTFQDWKGNVEQVDDVTFLGILLN
jgi:serine phosphatase RsbU (regulator of sigma subunit)